MGEVIEPTSPRRFSILAVDDERANLNLIRRTFRQDYDLHLAEDGLTGLNILKGHPVDLIITDQRMPGMTGVQMLVKSRDLVPDAVRIVLTAYADVRDIIDAINQGQIYQYVLKPWSPEELKITVGNALKHYALQMENRELVGKLRKSLADLKNAQQELLLRERLSTLGRMASSVIHDLKLPMTNIRSSAQLLARGDLTPNLRGEFSTVIMQEVDRLIDMTREILDYSRGELSLSRTDFSLDELLAEVVKMIEGEFGLGGITVEKGWDRVGRCCGDRDRLRRVLLNLVLNAREAMPNGGRVRVSAARGADGITLAVQDTGPGLPTEIIDHIFEAFVTHGKHNGTGLGMTIARKIVEAHSGVIKARNLPEGGACIEIVLPLKDEPHA